jgi:biopolymer transport protein ExbD
MGGAAEPQPSGKGGKKAMDAAINLVPYIDLLMTIMTFLVMTAVWTQIAALEVQNASGNAPQEPSEPDPDVLKAIFVLFSVIEVKV